MKRQVDFIQRRQARKTNIILIGNSLALLEFEEYQQHKKRPDIGGKTPSSMPYSCTAVPWFQLLEWSVILKTWELVTCVTLCEGAVTEDCVGSYTVVVGWIKTDDTAGTVYVVGLQGWFATTEGNGGGGTEKSNEGAAGAGAATTGNEGALSAGASGLYPAKNEIFVLFSTNIWKSHCHIFVHLN